jgi:hypothetical protein
MKLRQEAIEKVKHNPMLLLPHLNAAKEAGGMFIRGGEMVRRTQAERQDPMPTTTDVRQWSNQQLNAYLNAHAPVIKAILARRQSACQRQEETAPLCLTSSATDPTTGEGAALPPNEET